MTKNERQASFLHAEKHINNCFSVCKHSQPEALMAYNMVRKLANDEFVDMEEYRKRNGDPTA